MLTAVSARDLLDQQWMKTVKIIDGLKPHPVAEEYEETKALLSLLDRKLKAIVSIGTVIHGRGDDYTVWNFEGTLLGGLNDYLVDINFNNSPITMMNACSAILQRLILMRRLLRLAQEYFVLMKFDHPLHDSYMNEVYPYLLDWIEVQAGKLTEA